MSRLSFLYHEGVRCPVCGGQNWHIGRMTAECGKCGYALDMPDRLSGGGTFTVSKSNGWKGVHRD